MKDFHHTIHVWINDLDAYNFDQLCAKPTPRTWSLGQVYMHVIEATNHFIEQANLCLSTNDHAAEEMSAAAKRMFLNNAFPDAVLEGPPSNADTPQPDSKEQIQHELLNLKKQLAQTEANFFKSPYQGKTRHPGLQYFNASEWLQFAEMHLRHHLRQKERLDAFLTSANR